MSEPDEWEDSALTRALRAPGTPEELSDEQAVLDAFRKVNRRRGTLVRRIGLGGAGAVLAVGLTGGVAAAYTGSLPAPVQHFAHRTLLVLGVPDTPPASPSRVHVSGPSPTPSRPVHTTASSPAPSPKQSPSPATTTSPTSSPSASPTASPTSSPTATAIAVAGVSIKVSATRVDEGGTITITGRVTDSSGNPLTGRRVALTIRTTTDSQAHLVTYHRSDSKGRVFFKSPALVQDVDLRLVAKGAHSTATRVVVVPSLTAVYSARSLQISANPLWAGETLVVRTKADGVIATVTLDANGQAVLPIKLHAVRVRYFVTLRATTQHAAAHASVVAPSALNP